jgi:hypothetical protein
MAGLDMWRNPVTEHQAEEFTWWNVLPDSERRQWALEPFTSVGPLVFGMSPGEVSEALSGVTDEAQCLRYWVAQPGVTKSVIEEGLYRKSACTSSTGRND